jgi:hypothetical protein
MIGFGLAFCINSSIQSCEFVMEKIDHAKLEEIIVSLNDSIG